MQGSVLCFQFIYAFMSTLSCTYILILRRKDGKKRGKDEMEGDSRKNLETLTLVAED